MKNIKNGFTFLEILFTIAIIGLVSLLIANIIPSSFNIYDTSLSENESFANLNIIMDKLARDIRQGKEIIYLTTNTLTVRLSSNLTRTYALVSGSDGKKYFAVDGTILAGPIQTITFLGLDANMTYTTTYSQVKMVVYTLTLLDGKKISSTIGLRAENIRLGRVIITEIMYYPPRLDKNGSNINDYRPAQFIVIYNNTQNPIDLRGWSINNNVFTTTVSNTWTLLPGRSAIIGSSGSNLINTYYFPLSSYAIYIKTGSLGLGLNGNQLSTSSDSVILTDNQGVIVDQVFYSNTWGGYPKSTSGKYRDWYSLVRKDLEGDSNNSNTWTDSSNLNFVVEQGQVDYVCYCLIPKIIISEVMYYPAPYVKQGWNQPWQPALEFFEIHNPTHSSVSIQYISWNNNYAVFTEGNPISNLVQGTWNLSPGSYAIISGSSADITGYYGISYTVNYMKTSQSSLGPNYGELPNTSFTITLLQQTPSFSRIYTIDNFYYSYSLGGYPYTSPSLDRYYSIELKNLGLIGLYKTYNYSQNVSSSYSLCYTVFVSWENNNQGKSYYIYCTPGLKNSVSP